jgi:methylenetetrahydrofolate reductase (NADPH)
MNRLTSCASTETLCEVGVEYSIAQCEELRSWGVPGFHFYSLNKAAAVKRVLDALRLQSPPAVS